MVFVVEEFFEFRQFNKTAQSLTQKEVASAASSDVMGYKSKLGATA